MEEKHVFKEGDTIEMLFHCTGDSKRSSKGEICTLINDRGVLRSKVGGCSCQNYWKLIKNKNTIMQNLKEKFEQIFLKEPEKSFRKAGITDGNGTLTTDGTGIFLSWLLKAQGDAFKKEVVDELLKEEKE